MQDATKLIDKDTAPAIAYQHLINSLISYSIRQKIALYHSSVDMPHSPVSETRLSQITTDACDNAFQGVTGYIHAQTESWNGEIINSILQSLISETKESGAQYKFAVNSTIIQHLSDPRPSGTDAAEPAPSTGASKVGRRGMHSATGAYWNTEKDGIWNYKYEGGEAKGMDVVICIMWVAQ